jgi:hypothetical protein
MTTHQIHYDIALVVPFSFFRFRFCFNVSLAFFLDSRLPLSFFPFSAI